MTSAARVPTTHWYRRDAHCSGRRISPPGTHPRTTRGMAVTGAARGRTREPHLVYPFPSRCPEMPPAYLGVLGGRVWRGNSSGVPGEPSKIEGQLAEGLTGEADSPGVAKGTQSGGHSLSSQG